MIDCEGICNVNEITRNAAKNSVELREFDDFYYRNQFRVFDSEACEFIALGHGGQYIYVNMERDLVGVFLSSGLHKKHSAYPVNLMRELDQLVSDN